MSVDTLAFSLKEVQKARGSLESRLNEKRQKRKNIESMLEKVNFKLIQVKDLHTKMTETSKIAQHKVTQSQAQATSMEDSNNEKRDTLESINQKIKELQNQRTENMHKFEEELNKTAKRLVEAKDFYKDENLTEILAKSRETYSQLQLKGAKLDEETASVKKHLAVLEDQASETADEQIDKQAVMDIVTEEKDNVLKSLKSLNEEVQSTRNSLNKQLNGESQH